MVEIVLASGSVHRRLILQNSGVAFRTVPSTLDERAVEAPLRQAGTPPDDVASLLAEAKAAEVSARMPNALVIGADQTLALDDRIFYKAADLAEARETLLALSGRTHRLNSAVAIAVNGQTLWRHLAVADLTMRALSPTFIDNYLARIGQAALTSVGAYQIEGPGIQLMEAIGGDHSTIIGLPILPLLAELRQRGAIEA